MNYIAGLKPASRVTWGAEIRATLSLAWPLILSNLAQVALGLTDVIMMGWLGPESLAAGALATNLNFAFVIFGLGLLAATSPLIATELGRNRDSVRDVRHTVRQGLWTSIVIVVPIWAALWYGESILIALGQEPKLAHEAAVYLHMLQWSILPFYAYTVLRNFVSALERPRSATVVGFLAIGLNALLVWALMFGKFGLPALGLPGAGIGTTLTSTFLFLGLALIVTVDKSFRHYHLFARFWRPNWHRFREIWRLGMPIAFTLWFEVTVFNAATFLMGLIGAESIAAHAVAVQVASFTFMVPLGFGMAATVRVGRAYGAGDRVAMNRGGWTAWWLSFAYAGCTALIMLLAGRPLVGIFLDLDTPANQTVIGLAVTFLVCAGLFQFVDATQAAASGMLRGLHDTRVPMIIAAVGYWGIGLPLGALLAFSAGLRGVGIWIGLAVGLAVAATLLTLRWAGRMRKMLFAVSH